MRSDGEGGTVEISEICRVEGHAAVTVEVIKNKVSAVRLNVFEGARFFERIVLGHQYDEIPHITSRVCAICSTGHVIAAARAIEFISGFKADEITELYRELMHLGMIIESHATHICALALPDFVGARDLSQFAAQHTHEFQLWTQLRNLGSSIQTLVGGRPFHPVNLIIGGLSRIPSIDQLVPLQSLLKDAMPAAAELCKLLLSFPLPIKETAPCRFLALIPNTPGYGYFGDRVRCSDGWECDVQDYQNYLTERVVGYSHAKSVQAGGKPFMVGAMARLHFYSDRLSECAAMLYEKTPMANGDANTIWNNLAQSIEIVEAVGRCLAIIDDLSSRPDRSPENLLAIKSGTGVGAVECPRGTLYHAYELDSSGKILSADMITPSTQNTARIEEDIRVVAEHHFENADATGLSLESKLETLIRAYDPCNTCATHMVRVKSGTSSAAVDIA